MVVGDGVTTIEDSAFSGCANLTSLVIGSSVTTIGHSAFQDSTNFTSITVKAPTPPTLNPMSFKSIDDCDIYVPAESIGLYKTSPDWTEYANRIFAIA